MSPVRSNIKSFLGIDVYLELHVLEYCSPVWMSAAASHLGLHYPVVPKAERLNDGLVVYDLEHKRSASNYHET